MATELKELGADFEGPVKNAIRLPNSALFFTDPAGNHYAVYTPKDADAKMRIGATGRMTGVGYIELEAPDVEASIEFYTTVLGFELHKPLAKTPAGKLKMASGQTLILTEAPFSSKGLVMSRKVPGPHIAFYVPAANWTAAIAQLEQVGDCQW